MKPMRTRNVPRTIAVALGWAGLLLYGYAAAGLIGGAIPVNRGWRAPVQGVTIWVASNGIHTDLILPKVAAGVDWRPLLRPEHLRDPRYAGYGYAGFGWGDAKFYRETPEWRDVRPATVLAAAVGSDATLVHAIHLPRPTPAADVRPIVLTYDQYRRLADFIRATIAPAPKHQPGYGGYDAFYSARGRYSLVRTCNAWTGEALRHAGVRVGAWTPFPATVMWWF
jgi:uncharacterized protein (TIGR02117 family)